MRAIRNLNVIVVVIEVDKLILPTASISFLILTPLATHALPPDLSSKSCLGLCYPSAKLMIVKNHEM